jgi:uncharacterized protein (DUF1778 family)
MPRISKKIKRTSREYGTVELILHPDQLRPIKQAAEIKGMSISDFILPTADAAAIEIIESAESWMLTAADTQTFANLLLGPAEPSDHLKAAIRRYKLSVESV